MSVSQHLTPRPRWGVTETSRTIGSMVDLNPNRLQTFHTVSPLSSHLLSTKCVGCLTFFGLFHRVVAEISASTASEPRACHLANYFISIVSSPRIILTIATSTRYSSTPFSLFITVMSLASISTFIAVFAEREPTPIGTQHVALLLAAWGPVILFGK